MPLRKHPINPPGGEGNGSIQLGSAESVEFLDRPEITLCEIISDDGQYETDMFIMEKKSNGAWYGLKARTPNSRTGAGWPVYAADKKFPSRLIGPSDHVTREIIETIFDQFCSR